MNPGPFIKPVRASSLRRECETFEGEKKCHNARFAEIRYQKSVSTL